VPSAAIVFISYILFCYEIWGEIRMEKFFIIVILATAALMVSSIEFETMPRFDFSKPTNRIKVILLLAGAVGIMINASLVIFPLGMLYILYGIGKFLAALLFGNDKKLTQKIQVKNENEDS
jgi:phosphatidylserine synthase